MRYIKIALTIFMISLLCRAYISTQTEYFPIGSDLSRHIEIVKELVSDGKINYLHDDGTRRAYYLYPPGYYYLFSSVSELTGLSYSLTANLLSAFIFILSALIICLIAGEIAGKTAAATSLIISAIALPTATPLPSSICTYLLMPAIVYLWIRKEHGKKTLFLSFLFALTTAVTHFSYFFLILFASLALLLALFAGDRFKEYGRLWISTTYGIAAGFFAYVSLIGNFWDAFGFYTMSGLWVKILPFDLPERNLLSIIIVLLPSLVYLALQYVSGILNLMYGKTVYSLKPARNTILNVLIILFAVFFIISAAIVFVNPLLKYFFTPPIPFFAAKIAIGYLTGILSLGFPPLAVLIALPLPFLYLVSAGYLKRENNLSAPMLNAFFLLPLLILPLVLLGEIIHTSFYAFSRAAGYSVPALIVLSAFSLNAVKYGKTTKVILSAAFFILFLSALTDPLYEKEESMETGYRWLIDNTPVYADEYAFTSDLNGASYAEMTLDTKGYYHISRFPMRYASGLLRIETTLNSEDGALAPEIKTPFGTFRPGVKWKQTIPAGEADKIYSTKSIEFYHIV